MTFKEHVDMMLDGIIETQMEFVYDDHDPYVTEVHMLDVCAAVRIKRLLEEDPSYLETS